MNASLNEKLRSVRWGEYKLSDLFDIDSASSFNADSLVPGDEFDYVTRTSVNQGVLQTTGFINSDNLNPAGTWSLGLLQMDFFYRSRPWYAGQFMRKITPKIVIPPCAISFFTTVLNKQKSILLSVLVRNVDKTFKSIKVELPSASDGSIDFDFIRVFMEGLEQERIAALTSYLKTNQLFDCELSVDNKNAVATLGTIQWKEYRMGSLFDRIKTNKLSYKAKDLPAEAMGDNTLPCLTSSFNNQGLNYYVPYRGATVLKNVISLPSNSDVYRAYFQSSDFTVLSDAYAIDWKCDDRKLTREQYLFMVMCINKVTDRPIYSHKNKLGGWNVVKNKKIMLPVADGVIDFAFMHNLISAIEKLVIKDVVQYADLKTPKTKHIINTDTNKHK